MLDYWVQVLSIRLPLLETFLGVALELLVLVLVGSLGLLVSLQFLSQLLLSHHLLFFHLTLQLVSIFLVEIFPELIVMIFSLLQGSQLVVPGLLELLIVILLLLLLPLSLLNLLLQ